MPLNFNRRKKSQTLVGLDIQPGYIAAVQARVNGEVVVERAAGARLPADTMRDGEVLNADALTTALREMFTRSGLDRRVRIGVANQRTVLRLLELPPITDRKELAAAVNFQAAEQIPMPLSNAVLDFHPLGVIETPSGPRQRVALVAAQRDMVEKLLSAVRQADLRPEGIDLSAFAMIRSLYRHSADEEGRVLYLNVGGLTNMAIANGATCYFTRVLGGGLEAMAVEIAERREISLDLARNLLSDTGVDPQAAGNDAPTLKLAPAVDEPEPQHPALSLSRPTQPEDWGVEVDAEKETAVGEPSNLPDVIQPEVAQAATDEQADVRMVLENGAREIAGEVRNSLDFYRAQDRTAEVNSVVLSGPALGIEGFAEALQNHLGLPVTCETVRSLEHSHPDVSLDHLAIAAGLAAEEIHV
jgi:type IV pilus assembly protein PilM